MVLIERYPADLSQLRLISQTHGIGYSDPPVLVDTLECVAFLDRDDVESVQCKTGFGQFTMRKRSRGGEKKYWHAYRRAGGILREAYVGVSSGITVERLDEVAIKLYESE
jgi:hypothetical protein